MDSDKVGSKAMIGPTEMANKYPFTNTQIL